MATKQARGMKRTCQSGECGARFYDLNNNPIVCPICGSVYELASAPFTAMTAAEEKAAARRAKKPEFVAEKAVVAEAVEGDLDEALPELEEAEEEAATPAEDETFLEPEEEEGGDVSNIIGGPVAEGNEER